MKAALQQVPESLRVTGAQSAQAPFPPEAWTSLPSSATPSLTPYPKLLPYYIGHILPLQGPCLGMDGGIPAVGISCSFTAGWEPGPGKGAGEVRGGSRAKGELPLWADFTGSSHTQPHQ